MPPKRKAVLEAAKLDPEIDSPPKRRKVTKKTTKKEKASALTEKLPTTTNKTEKSDKSAPAKRRPIKRERHEKPSEKTETELAEDHSKSEETEERHAVSPTIDKVESNDEVEAKEELPKKAKRGKQPQKETKSAALNTKDEVKSSKGKRGKPSEKTETELAEDHLTSEETEERHAVSPTIDKVESNDEVEANEELPKKAKRGKQPQKETKSAVLNTKDEVKSSKEKRGKPSEKTETELAEDHLKSEETEERHAVSPTIDKVESNDEVEAKEELPKRAKRGKQLQKETKAAALNTKNEGKTSKEKRGKPSEKTETELAEDHPKSEKLSEETEERRAVSPSVDKVESNDEEELPQKAKRGKQSQKETKALNTKDVKLSKGKKEKQSEQTETEPAASNSKDEEPKEELPTKAKKRNQSQKETKAVLRDEELQDEVKLLKKAKRGKQTDTETQSALSNTTDTKWDHIDFGCNKKNSRNKGYNLKVTSWNIGGLRAWLKKSGMKILDHDQPDIFCLQETKCSNEKLPEEVRDIPGYHDYWVSSEKEGYAGVAVYTKIVPEKVIYGIGKEDFDNEGRCITLEFEGFYLVNVYVPNAGRKLVTLPKRLEWNDHFEAFIKNLDQSKPVIICGDMNVAHTEIDLANPKTNQKNAGFTIEERDGMTNFLKCGYVDTFRHLYPEITNSYTFWSYMSNARAKNVGWRLDYFILSERIIDKVCDCVIRSQIYGSDHCPISLFVSI